MIFHVSKHVRNPTVVSAHLPVNTALICTDGRPQHHATPGRRSEGCQSELRTPDGVRPRTRKRRPLTSEIYSTGSLGPVERRRTGAVGTDPDTPFCGPVRAEMRHCPLLLDGGGRLQGGRSCGHSPRASGAVPVRKPEAARVAAAGSCYGALITRAMLLYLN